MNTEFYDASQGGIPNTPSLGQPTDKKHRTLLSAVYGSHEIEVRRSYGPHGLIVDGKVYGREEGVVESGYTISARVGGHAIETEFTPRRQAAPPGRWPGHRQKAAPVLRCSISRSLLFQKASQSLKSGGHPASRFEAVFSFIRQIRRFFLALHGETVSRFPSAMAKKHLLRRMIAPALKLPHEPGHVLPTRCRLPGSASPSRITGVWSRV